MKPEDFTDRPDVVDLIASLRRDCAARAYSDIVDDHGNQYVDIVMAGGGLLGIAIVGYLYALEEVGIRFLRIGGTSAGSITALLLAALDNSDQKKAVKLIEILSQMDTWSFVDGGSSAQALVRDYLDQKDWLELAFDWARVVPEIWTRRGLNPGDRFQTWLSGVLRQYGVETTSQLRDRIRHLPQTLKRRESDEHLSTDELDPRLALVAADIATETKVDFPRMAPLYWTNSDELDPAIYVRASMSIPFFFQPFIVENIPQGDAAQRLWVRLAGYKGHLPIRCGFIDGGIMSNFPIGIFHEPDTIPPAPTLGISLGSRDRSPPNSFDSVWKLSTAIFDSARHSLDYDFIAKNPDYEKLVGYINIDGFNWLDFNMTDQHKIELFVRGVEAAKDFLTSFEWENYKRIRDHLAKAHEVKKPPPTNGAPGPAPVVSSLRATPTAR